MLFPYMCSKRIQQISFQNSEIIIRDNMMKTANNKKNNSLVVLS